ncbi:hypothetical protein [Brumicola pallidula]|jgi:hypothetical protein|uniref:Uncharacterized protein n=1 Tax=Brumicola pallidula DSM 14239 = ACAM 615 TaxID=1121922 RepID=K6ZJ60_9ALTE|nr:hypothetical protein [Glaciecola pallidula]GAC28918.1 hypothetical protein GPAL_2057 [Glaciecola pallidula DSM 14239 = ACAM 615]
MDRESYVKNITQLLPKFEDSTASIVLIKRAKKRRFQVTNLFMISVCVCFSLCITFLDYQFALAAHLFLVVILLCVYINYLALQDVFFLREQLTKNMKLIMTASEIIESKVEVDDNLLATISNHLDLDGSELINKAFEIGFRVKER